MNCKLSLRRILNIVYPFLYTYETLIKYAEIMTGRSHSTRVDWYNLCREVRINIFQRKDQMVETIVKSIQIYEARFSGMRKYNRGRFLQGNLAPKSTESEAEVENNRNHDNRIDGPWVFGPNKGLDCRYFYVNRRTTNTLLPTLSFENARQDPYFIQMSGGHIPI